MDNWDTAATVGGGAVGGALGGPLGAAGGAMAGHALYGMFSGGAESGFNANYADTDPNRSDFYYGGSQDAAAENRKRFQDAQNQYQQRTGQQYMGGYNQGMGQSNADRSQQQQYAQMLQDRAMGKGQSAAELLMQQGNDRAIQAQMAAAASAPGENWAAASRNASNAATQLQQENLRQTGILRAQEQQQYAGMLGGALQNMRGQDLQGGELGLRYGLGQQGLNDQMTQGYLNAEMQNNQGQMAANNDYWQLLQQGRMNARGLNEDTEKENAKGRRAVFGGLLDTGIGLL